MAIKSLWVTSVDISLGTVLKALITRAVSLDISIYTIKEGKFSSAPSIRKTISAKFDFSSGDLFVPAVLGADITGDGRKDLLVQKGEGDPPGLSWGKQVKRCLLKKRSNSPSIFLRAEPEFKLRIWTMMVEMN